MLFNNKQTWEDPAVDVKKLDINKDDHILAITSAGDNVLHYALTAKPARIHAVGQYHKILSNPSSH